MKQLPFLSTVVIVCMVLIVTMYTLMRAWPDGKFHVIHCDVGQGDAVVITYNFTQVLIDSGRDDKVVQCLERYLPFTDKTLEFVIVTHPDNDHIGGFPAVFEQYSVSHLFLLGAVKDTKMFQQFHAEVVRLRLKGTSIQLAEANQRLVLGPFAELTVLFPLKKVGKIEHFYTQLSETQLSALENEQSAHIKSVNDVSIATKLVVGKHTHLLMADVEKGGELALLSMKLIPDVDILKAGHHGSNTSTTIDFLNASRPEYIVISSGKNNQYGHPHPKVIERIETLSSRVLRTDLDGDIEWISDGTTFQWKTSRNNRKVSHEF